MFAYFGFESLPQSESPGGVRRPPGHPQNSQPDHALSTGLGGAAHRDATNASNDATPRRRFSFPLTIHNPVPGQSKQSRALS